MARGTKTHRDFVASRAQGPEEMCLSLEYQNPSKTSEKMGYFDHFAVLLHILRTGNQQTEGSQDRLIYSIGLRDDSKNGCVTD